MPLTLSFNELSPVPARVIRRAVEDHQPVILDQAGEAIAVVQAMEEYQRKEADREFMRAIIQGLMDMETGREVSLAEARARLGRPVYDLEGYAKRIRPPCEIYG